MLIIIGMLGLGATLMLVRALNVAALSDPRRTGNSRVLDDAKAALLMYVSIKVATENYPGKLPCPEDTSKIGTGNEGSALGNCPLPAVGRLPWKTLELAAAPLDMDGEQLWYAVSPGFNFPSGGSVVINSNTPAGLTVDGSPARAVALIFSPGRMIGSQSRPAVSSASPPLAANYLEGENATPTTPDIKFATYGPAGGLSTVFNDQAVIVTHQDLFNVVEPAVAKRLNDRMVNGTKPLTGIYASASWGASSAAPVFPYAAPFANPDTSTFQGASGTSQGLLPVTFSTAPGNASQYCNPVTDGVRCDPTFVRWSSFGSLTKQSGMTLYASPAPTCSVTNQTLSCVVYTSTSGSPLKVSLVATASKVAMALRQLDFDAATSSDFAGSAASATINSDGSATLTLTGQVDDSGTTVFFTCAGASFGICKRRAFDIPIRVFGDHPIINSLDSEYGWFTRNEWHKLTYYAIAPAFAASGARSCTSPNCLTIKNLGTSPNNDKRALLILAGGSIGSQTQPSGTLSNYLESENVSPVDTTFEILKPSRTFNDRVVVVDTN